MDENILLTVEQVLEWKRQRDEISEQISKLNARQALLSKKIEAAALFMRDDSNDYSARTKQEQPEQKTLIQTESASEDTGVTLVDAILSVLKGAEKPLSNKQIKRQLGGTGFDVDRLRTSPNYFYTATKRLVDRDMIVKLDSGKYIIKEFKTPGEYPSKEAPGADQDSQTSHLAEPHAKGREAGPGGGT